jgi:transaldolase
MRFFIDSANIEEIKAAKSMGIFDGLTTNPSLIAIEKNRTKKKFLDIIRGICEVVDGKPVSVEVLSTKFEEMVAEGQRLAEVNPDCIVIKLPCTEDGLKACAQLTQEGYKTNLTLCFSPLQALLAAKAGATYISPFIGRLDDEAEYGINKIAEIKTIYMNYGFRTQVLVASIRNPLHILDSAKIGADVVTVPFMVIKQMMKNHRTQIGLEKFLADAKAANQPNVDR